MKKKVFKSVKNKRIFGICGGLSEFLNINPILLRVIFTLLVVLRGAGIALYLLLYLFMPERPKLQIVKTGRYCSKDLGERRL